LLQTEKYVRTITAAGFPSDKEEDSERKVAVRLARQDLLNRPEPPEYLVVIEETVLHIGRPDVMRGQIGHLIETAERPSVTVLVRSCRAPRRWLVGGGDDLREHGSQRVLSPGFP
jgi:hypothetical protein